MLETGPDEVRYTLIIDKETKAKMVELGEKYKVTQPEMIEAFFNHLDELQWAPIFEQVRQDKIARRAKRKELMRSLKKLGADELAKALAAAQSNPGSKT